MQPIRDFVAGLYPSRQRSDSGDVDSIPTSLFRVHRVQDLVEGHVVSFRSPGSGMQRLEAARDSYADLLEDWEMALQHVRMQIGPYRIHKENNQSGEVFSVSFNLLFALWYAATQFPFLSKLKGKGRLAKAKDLVISYLIYDEQAALLDRSPATPRVIFPHLKPHSTNPLPKHLEQWYWAQQWCEGVALGPLAATATLPYIELRDRRVAPFLQKMLAEVEKETGENKTSYRQFESRVGEQLARDDVEWGRWVRGATCVSVCCPRALDVGLVEELFEVSTERQASVQPEAATPASVVVTIPEEPLAAAIKEAEDDLGSLPDGITLPSPQHDEPEAFTLDLSPLDIRPVRLRRTRVSPVEARNAEADDASLPDGITHVQVDEADRPNLTFRPITTDAGLVRPSRESPVAALSAPDADASALHLARALTLLREVTSPMEELTRRAKELTLALAKLQEEGVGAAA